MLKQFKNKNKKGFTLIELVIVLAVLAIIALIAIPNFNKVREDSRIKADKMSLESIAKVIEIQLIDEKIPDTFDGTVLVEPYVEKPQPAKETPGPGVTQPKQEKGVPNVTITPGSGEEFDGRDDVEKFLEAGLKGIGVPQEKDKVAYTLNIVDGELDKSSFDTTKKAESDESKK